MMLNHIAQIIRMIGPGIVMASAAIGVSHLVQSTRAGANFGYQLLPVIFLVMLLKYPFIEYGYRYTLSTGKNLVQGYKELGDLFLRIFVFINAIATFGGIAIISFVTAAFAQIIFSTSLDLSLIAGILMLACFVILIIGHYKWLDILMKWLMAVLLLATSLALSFSFLHRDPVHAVVFSETTSVWQADHMPFIVALMGWMPGPIELSIWLSLWVQAKTRHQPLSFKQGRMDFNIGYVLTFITAIQFLILGTFIPTYSGQGISADIRQFAEQFITVYTHTIGDWSRPIISLAAFTAMFSTTLSLIDAYPRSLTIGVKEMLPHLRIPTRKLQAIITAMSCVFAVVMIDVFTDDFKLLIDSITIIAFLSAPFLAYMNYYLIFSSHTPHQVRPGPIMKGLSWLGLLYLAVMGLVYLFFILGAG